MMRFYRFWIPSILLFAPAIAEASWLPGWGSNDGTPGIDDSWCYGANIKLYVGDFDGNGRSDLMCHSSSSGQRRIDFQYATYRGFWGTNWDSYTDGAAVNDWCSESGEELFVGDFNADGRDDLLCRVRGGSTNAGRKQIDFADANGHFDDTDFDTLDYPSATQNWCTNSGESIFVGDFNGDGKDDLMCRVAAGYTNAGRKRVDYANSNGTFFGTEWDTLGNGSVEQSWCTASGESVRVGDFSGDGKDDLLCHIALGYINGGRRRVDFAGSGTTLFTGTDWSSADSQSAVPSWCATTGDVLNIGDVNDDGKEDLLCTNKAYGGLRVDHANGSGTFFGTNGQAHQETWCTDSDENVHVGDFDGDGHTDTLCHDDTTGYRAIRYANSGGDYHSICSNDSIVGDGELPQLPVHFAVVSDPNNLDVPSRQTNMPSATSSHVHPIDGTAISADPTTYFEAEVEVMNYYTKTYYPLSTDVCVGDDCIEYAYESHTLYDDIDGNTSCTDLLDWGNVPSVEYAGNCIASVLVPDGACYPKTCPGNPITLEGGWTLGFACAIRTCEDPEIRKPHTLNIVVMDRCVWDFNTNGISDDSCVNDWTLSFGLGGDDFFAAWDYELMLRGPHANSLPRATAIGLEQHELGHMLGLWHTTTCAESKNAMDEDYTCPPPSGVLWRGEGYSEDIENTDQPSVMINAARTRVEAWACN
jgi:hypothetical protein